MIKEYIPSLLSIAPNDWVHYAFLKEPIIGRLDNYKKQEYFTCASKCGIELARIIKNQYPKKSIIQCAEIEGAIIELSEPEQNGIQKVFATFTEPKNILISKNISEGVDELIHAHGFSKVLGDVSTFEVLLAHEFFHYLESKNLNIYTKQKHLPILKLWKWEYRVPIPCLQEIGAMAFTKEFFNLTYSPYLYDILMLYVSDPEGAEKLFNTITDLVRRADNDLAYHIRDN